VPGPVRDVNTDRVASQHVLARRVDEFGDCEGGGEYGRRRVNDDRLERIVEINRVTERRVGQRGARDARCPASQYSCVRSGRRCFDVRVDLFTHTVVRPVQCDADEIRDRFFRFLADFIGQIVRCRVCYKLGAALSFQPWKALLMQ